VEEVTLVKPIVTMFDEELDEKVFKKVLDYYVSFEFSFVQKTY